VIDQLKPVQEKFYSRFGTHFALLGDEIYLKAERRIPSRSHYGSYPQIEDGVGMVRSFHEEFARLQKRLARFAPEIEEHGIEGLPAGGDGEVNIGGMVRHVTRLRASQQLAVDEEGRRAARAEAGAFGGFPVDGAFPSPVVEIGAKTEVRPPPVVTAPSTSKPSSTGLGTQRLLALVSGGIGAAPDERAARGDSPLRNRASGARDLPGHAAARQLGR